MRRFKPEITEMPRQTVAVVTTKGTPSTGAETAMPALYGSVYTLKFDLKKRGLDSFSVSCPRARYPDADLCPQDEWTIHWALPVPNDTRRLLQKTEAEVKVESWDYGAIAQVLHIGPYSDVGPTIELLTKFIDDNGYEICGAHEEEYITRPNVKEPKTIIRYQVRKKR